MYGVFHLFYNAYMPYTNKLLYNTGLFTDFYSLTMLQGYYYTHKNLPVVFDMFFRNNPFQNGFSIFAGLESLLQRLEKFSFTREDIEYLREIRLFKDEFLNYLKNFRFTGTIYAMREGSVCFPGEPLIRVHTSIMEAQLIEGLVLNTVNYQTLIATKSARICLSARDKKVTDMGLRRAHGPNGALFASRAAYIGGAIATSNVQAGKEFGIPVSGTMSHAWVMSFKSEREAFEAYANIYPDNAVFLLDTYDTLKSGVENAIVVGKKLQERGKKFGVRLDSGDIEYLSQEVRKRLDEANLTDTFIGVSNELDETIIAELTANNCPVDVWGVGANLTTGGGGAAFSGVYKLSARKNVDFDDLGEGNSFTPTMKISENLEKVSLPGIKQVYRYIDPNTDCYVADVVALEDEQLPSDNKMTSYHPHNVYKKCVLNSSLKKEQLLSCVMKNGQVSMTFPTIQNIQEYARNEIKKLDKTVRRRINPHIYPVAISEKLKNIRDEFITGKK